MSISLVTFNEQTVTPQDDALVYQSALRKSGIIYGCEVTKKSASVLHIASGHGVIAGRKFTVEAQDISIQLSSSGTLNGRLYVHLDLSNALTPISLLTERASTLTPPIQNADVNITNGVYEFNLATFKVSTSQISSLKSVALKYGAISKTLSAYTTTLTFDNLPTTGNYLIDFYTSSGINYTAIDTSVSGRVTLTFDEQLTSTTVYCDIREA